MDSLTTTSMIRTLDQLLPGQTAVVKQVGGRGDFRRRVTDLGLTKGAEIEMMGSANMGDPIDYRIGERHVTLRRAEARVIVVDM